MYEQMSAADLRRFWSKVQIGEPDECWPWLAGKRDDFGYGDFWLNGRNVIAHRLVLEIKLRRVLKRTEWACHECDNPACCNPNHLFLGDRRKNVADMVQKQRHARGKRHGAYTQPESRRTGEKNGKAVMTKERVIRLRERLAKGEPYDALAVEFDISKATVAQIATGRTWKHVAGPVRSAGTLPPRLSPEQRWALRKDRAAGMSYPELGHKYGVSTATAHNICKAGRDERSGD